MNLTKTLAIGLGGILGTWLRYAASIFLTGQAFPWATLFVNVTGSLCLGYVTTRVQKDIAKNFWGTGVLGSYTTFSLFAVEIWELPLLTAVLYTFASLFFGIFFAYIGLRWGRRK
ncbi:fluoride efflux transporter FluC [Risungbinella massiliensis]|uniref:fluoride efflux transporter FluC n=1 Tax=Risungbinella massiliensis TaxID=1329796 RepID=UPI0005CBB3E0|nr:CrcB family protein [Risungbinella massiliensis]